MRRIFLALLIHLAAVLSPECNAADSKPSSAASGSSAKLMEEWLLKQAGQCFQNWDEKYKTLKTPEQIEAYQKRLRDQFVEKLGGFPERTQLNAKVTGIVPRDGYRVEKVIFESQPGHFVTGLCFVPQSSQFQAPYPGVLIVCGHSANGKGMDAYQSGAALAALNGLVAFLVDPVCQGERYEHLTPEGVPAWTDTTSGHSMLGLGAILLGQNTARNEIWDGMRAIDYLQERDDVIPEKIGCMGNSGGGTQTAYLMSLDNRIQAAAPACYITSFQKLLTTIGPQDAEQNIFGQLEWGMDHADYLIMRAPSPVLICAATQDFFSIDGAKDSFRKAREIFTRLGAPDHVELFEAEGKHGWQQAFREASVAWMCRWLAGREVEVHEPKLQLLTEKEFQVTDQGQVLLLAGAKSAFQLNVEEFEKTQAARDQLWANPEHGIQKVRQLAGIRSLESLPALEASQVSETKEGTITIERWNLTCADGLTLPALLYRPEKPTKGPLLCTLPGGNESKWKVADQESTALSQAQAGHLVLSVDLCGIGKSIPKDAAWYRPDFGPDARYTVTAYLLGRNFIGLRGEEILQVSRWFLQHESLPTDERKLSLLADGRLSLAALHAAAVEPDLFGHVTLLHAIPSWRTIIEAKLSRDQIVNCVHGAARAYDLPHLVQLLGDRCEILEPVNARGEPIP
ncbi:alpha/beta hydrolase family protein [Planctomicrobium sp. SH661]|uniref:alpha/beta hydrolase family protein n=1 Tax=Planctomicrobium sp. SH661 TaxID=3448124 RepID=UPI003F5B6BEA